jgi:hypothetical protein
MRQPNSSSSNLSRVMPRLSATSPMMAASVPTFSGECFGIVIEWASALSQRNRTWLPVWRTGL